MTEQSPPPAFNEEHHSTGHFTDIPAGHLQALKSTLHFDQSADEVVPRPTPTNGRYKIAKTSLDQGPAPGFNPNVPPPERVRRSVEMGTVAKQNSRVRHLEYADDTDVPESSSHAPPPNHPPPAPDRPHPQTPPPPPEDDGLVYVKASTLKFTKALQPVLDLQPARVTWLDPATTLLDQPHTKEFSPPNVHPSAPLNEVLEQFRKTPNFNIEHVVGVSHDASVFAVITARDVASYLIRLPIPSPHQAFGPGGSNPITEAYEHYPAGHLANHGRLNPLVRLTGDHNLGDVCALFGFGFHVALIDSVEKFVTQFDLLNWIVDKKDKFKDIWKKRLSELGLIDSQVVSISEREPVARALVDMYERKISAVAVLDDDEHLVSYMTVNDVIYLNAEIHPRLFTPIRRFLKTLDRKLLYASERMTFGRLLKRMLVEGTPRVWVTHHHQVTGVITLTSLFNFLATEYHLQTGLTFIEKEK